MDGSSPSGFTSSDYSGMNISTVNPSPNNNVITTIFDPSKV